MAPVKLLRVGDLVEALDLEGQWYPARVMQQASEGLSVLLHFDGWSDSYDEWLPHRPLAHALAQLVPTLAASRRHCPASCRSRAPPLPKGRN